MDVLANKKQELYNIKNDEGERKDISAENPEITKKLYAQLQTWRKSIGINTENMDKKLEKQAERKAEKKEERKANKQEKN